LSKAKVFSLKPETGLFYQVTL